MKNKHLIIAIYVVYENKALVAEFNKEEDLCNYWLDLWEGFESGELIPLNVEIDDKNKEIVVSPSEEGCICGSVDIEEMMGAVQEAMS